MPQRQQSQCHHMQSNMCIAKYEISGGDMKASPVEFVTVLQEHQKPIFSIFQGDYRSGGAEFGETHGYRIFS